MLREVAGQSGTVPALCEIVRIRCSAYQRSCNMGFLFPLLPGGSGVTA